MRWSGTSSAPRGWTRTIQRRASARSYWLAPRGSDHTPRSSPPASLPAGRRESKNNAGRGGCVRDGTRRCRFMAEPEGLSEVLSTGEYRHLRIERRGFAAFVTLARPEVHNAFNARLIAELQAAF